MLWALAAFIAPVISMAQMPQPQPLPMDSAVRVGQLPNGLTYFIRHNAYPKGQADFFIAQKVGSILEEDNQRGLAHFLEHMAFNGTKQFPGHQLRDWLASKGVMFGRDLNAYTGFDETVYNISSVPVEGKSNVVDSCLMILHDWSCDLTLADKDIDEERGVIEQEWRRSNVGIMRAYEQMLPKLFPDSSRYGRRLPIGTMDVVLNFKPDELRDYYDRWYRPDQQGIIVVGDIDPDVIEAKIKEIFTPVTMPADAPERRYFTVPDFKGSKVAIGTDPEIPMSIVSFNFAYDPLPRELRNTMAGFVVDYMDTMIAGMLNQRLEDISSKSDAPFASAYVNIGEMLSFVKTKHAFSAEGVAKDGDIKPVLESVYREVLRAMRGGFTQTELDRVKAEYISKLEKAYNNRNTHPSTQYARAYVRTFVDNESALSLKDQLDMTNMIAGMVNVDAINQYFKELVTPDNRYIEVFLPEKEGVVVPTEAELGEIMAKVEAEDIEPYKEELRQDPLIPGEIASGSVVSVKPMEKWDAEEWTLSNGAKVVVKPTKLKDDEILFGAWGAGGSADYKDLSDETAQIMGDYLTNLSAGTYSAQDLRKYTAGKNFSVHIGCDDYQRYVSGTTTVKDLPSMLEVFYATFTSPNLDAEEFAAMTNQLVTYLTHASSNPQMVMTQDMLKSMFASPRKQYPTVEAVKKADREQIIDMIKAMTSNAAELTYYFVGNIDKDTLKPLVEKYIASLPGKAVEKKNLNYDPAFGIKAGKNVDKYTMKMDTPQIYGRIVVSGNEKLDLRSDILSTILEQVLTERLLNKIREEMGAVYSISARVRISRFAKPNTTIVIPLLLKPEKADEAIVEVNKILDSVTEEIKPEELAKAKETLVKDYRESFERNSTWLTAMSVEHTDGADIVHGAVEATEAVTAEDVIGFAKSLISQGNHMTVLLEPEKAE